VYEESIVHPDDRDRVATHLRSFAARQTAAVCAMDPCPLRRLRKDGSWVRMEGGGVREVRSAASRSAGGGSRGADSSSQGLLFFSHGRDISALFAAEAAVKDLLMCSSFELRGHAQLIEAASSLLSSHPAVTGDPEAVFLATALQSSSNLLLGALRRAFCSDSV